MKMMNENGKKMGIWLLEDGEKLEWSDCCTVQSIFFLQKKKYKVFDPGHMQTYY